MNLLTSRFGLAGIVAAVLAVVIGGLMLSRAGLLADLADAERRVAILEAAVKQQNAAVIAMQEAGARDQAERTARALRVLTPPRRPTPQTAEELNRWLATP